MKRKSHRAATRVTSSKHLKTAHPGSNEEEEQKEGAPPKKSNLTAVVLVLQPLLSQCELTGKLFSRASRDDVIRLFSLYDRWTQNLVLLFGTSQIFLSNKPSEESGEQTSTS